MRKIIEYQGVNRYVEFSYLITSNSQSFKPQWEKVARYHLPTAWTAAVKPQGWGYGVLAKELHFLIISC